MQQFIGNLIKDAKSASVGGKNVINFSLVENRPGKNQGEGTLIQSAIWEREKVLPYLKKGALVSVIGYVIPATHEGKLFLKIERIAELRLLGGPKTNSAGQSANAAAEQDTPF